MRDEAEKVRFQLRRQEKQAKKEFEKKMLLAFPTPFLFHCIYTVPSSRNRYLLWYEAISGQEVRNKTFRYGAALIVNEERNKLSVWSLRSVKDNQDGAMPMLMCLTGHFLQRYRERCRWGSRLSTEELIVRFLSRNTTFFAELDFSKINVNANKYPDGTAYQIIDGVAFVKCKRDKDNSGSPFLFAKFNTFVSESELKDDQKQNVLDVHGLTKALFMSTMLKEHQDLFDEFGDKVLSSPTEKET